MESATRIFRCLMLAVLALMMATPALAVVSPVPMGDASIVIGEITVAASDVAYFGPRTVYYDDAIYSIHVELPAGESTGMDLLTVVSKWTKSGDTWSATTTHTIENRTMADKYHACPSIAVDKLGYIHVAYNMHCLPWQYSVTTSPGDISSWDFRGEAITAQDIYDLYVSGHTDFPVVGSADIPGTQITYPQFFKDHDGELYITYRGAVKPKRAFVDRAFGGWIAKYDAYTHVWTGIGGDVVLSAADADSPATVKVFAYRDAWTVYLPWLFFDSNNDMHVSFMWREGTAGTNCTDPTYAFSDDGGTTFEWSTGTAYAVPLTTANALDGFGTNAGDTEWYAQTCVTTDASNNPYIKLHNINVGGVKIVSKSGGTWSVVQTSPYYSSYIFADKDGDAWAFATGLRARTLGLANPVTSAALYYENAGYGYQKTAPTPEKAGFLVYVNNASDDKARIYWIKVDGFEDYVPPTLTNPGYSVGLGLTGVRVN